MAPGTALLVEDEPLVAFVAAECLTAFGFSVEVAETGAQALAALELGVRGTALAVVDVGLPDMRGDTLARRMKAMAPELRIVVASGYDVAELRHTLDPAFGILAKPYGETTLRAALADLGYDLPPV